MKIEPWTGQQALLAFYITGGALYLASPCCGQRLDLAHGTRGRITVPNYYQCRDCRHQLGQAPLTSSVASLYSLDSRVEEWIAAVRGPLEAILAAQALSAELRTIIKANALYDGKISPPFKATHCLVAS